MDRWKSNESTHQIIGLRKDLKIFLQSGAKKEIYIFGIVPTCFPVDSLGTFNVPRLQLPLVLIMKDKVKELSNCIKVFAIGAGDKEVFAEGTTSVGDRTVGESFVICCLRVTRNFVFIKS